MLAAETDARAHAAFEITAEDIGGTGREALVELTIERRVVAEQVRDTRPRIPAKRLVAVAVFQIVDRVDEVVCVECRRAR